MTAVHRRAAAALMAAAAGGAVWLVIAGGRTTEATPPQAYVVTIENAEFRPAVLSAAPGDRVVWTNRDLFPHTVTAPGGAFDSHDIALGASWVFVFDTAGDRAYVCSYHPTMTGIVRVSPVAQR